MTLYTKLKDVGQEPGELPKLPMTAEAFREHYGVDPEQDDVDRVNCETVGSVGHFGCGLCPATGKPRFSCPTCLCGQAHP